MGGAGAGWLDRENSDIESSSIRDGFFRGLVDCNWSGWPAHLSGLGNPGTRTKPRLSPTGAATHRQATSAGRTAHDSAAEGPYSPFERRRSMKMMAFNRWIVAVGVLGAMAMLAAAGLLWLVLTRPIDVAAFVQRFS
jgi:hypothetical protein